MPKLRGSTTHHCPKKNEGNCRKRGRLCTAHQKICNTHSMVHLQDEPCPACEKARTMEEKKKENLCRCLSTCENAKCKGGEGCNCEVKGSDNTKKCPC